MKPYEIVVRSLVALCVALAACAAAPSAHAQAGGRLSAPEPPGLPLPAPRAVALQEVRALRLAGRPEAALDRAELGIAAACSLPPRSLRALIREVGDLDNPAADRTWIHAAAVTLPFGGAGLFATGFSWLMAGFDGWDQYEHAGLGAGFVLSGALLVAGISLLFVHLGDNTCDSDHRAFERRRRDVLAPLHVAHRRARERPAVRARR